MRDQSGGPRSRRPAGIEDVDAEDEAAEEEASEGRPSKAPRARKAAKPRVTNSDVAPVSRRSKAPPKGRVTPEPPKVKTETVRPEAAKTAAKGKGSRSRANNASSKKGSALDHDAEKFFAEGEAAHEPAPHDEEPAGLPGHATVSPERRRAFLRYVGIAIAVCAVLCLAALARMALADRPTVSHEHRTTEIATPIAVAPAPPPQPAAAPPPPVAAASGSAAPIDEAPAVPEKTALEERNDARRALERGRMQEAIDAAVRSTTLDPTDADAWLLLGAAYMDRGKSADARAAFSSCAKLATKGPVGECRLMLR